MKPLGLRFLPAALLTILVALVSSLTFADMDDQFEDSQGSYYQNATSEQETEDYYMNTGSEEESDADNEYQGHMYYQNQEEMDIDEEEMDGVYNYYDDDEEDGEY
ncbi:hypothetical protein NX722_01190 [Endozoicomonas gorgoniicola]|uniref:Uncharacterized protein n=1 Tax=Endozoicomonas gorgoniicola TaxID=1234144 RepID=A0ABT3MPI0_9GAMM|nr:hypothetical protein [Endozoicomonas gorgoniicola]MCW7551276.1 hypothetical protein [Endozoicomonas gorgoniicola]